MSYSIVSLLFLSLYLLSLSLKIFRQLARLKLKVHDKEEMILLDPYISWYLGTCDSCIYIVASKKVFTIKDHQDDSIGLYKTLFVAKGFT